MSFTWIPLYSEIAHKVLEFENLQGELLSLLGQMRADGLKVIAVTDRDAAGDVTPLTEIDPFTFFASFNRHNSVTGRQAILARIKAAWHLSEPVPDDFDGIPIANAQNSWAFAYLADRTSNDIPVLWRAAREGVANGWRTFDRTLFDEALNVKRSGVAKLSISLFWLNPQGFLPCERHTRAFFKERGIVAESWTAAGYFSWLEQVVANAGEGFPQISLDAYQVGGTVVEPRKQAEFKRWMGPILDALRELGGSGTPKQVEDIIARTHSVTDAQRGILNEKSGQSQFSNQVAWGRQYLIYEGLIVCHQRGVWTLTERGQHTTLSIVDVRNIVRKWIKHHRELRKQRAGGQQQIDAESDTATSTAATTRRYWWLNANPRVWEDFRSAPVGSVATYTSRNAVGRKRQNYNHFAAARPGDVLFAYATNPDREIVAVCEITKALHNSPEGEAIEFRKVEGFSVPVTWADLQTVPALAHCQPLIGNRGRLFAVTLDEYEAIRAIIDDAPNFDPQPPKCPRFTKADALDSLFMKESRLDEILARLRRKKAIILQGPPGVGKTFIARRLAFALMEERDDRRVAMVQFHPSYGYEDFVQGYRPTRLGLERRDGVFYQFARLARNDPQRDWFFVIDEINRGNLAKIFGELLMLIEADKRGPDHAIPLTYSEQADETFHLPSNLHFIGTMNTADRSLAMVDYALRRRFAFVTLDPEFDSPEFDAWLTGRGATAALIVRIRDRIGELNEVIEKERDLGPGFRVGHSFFCPPPDHMPDDAWYREVIEGEIQPLLEEYFDSRERVDKLVSDLLA